MKNIMRDFSDRIEFRINLYTNYEAGFSRELDGKFTISINPIKLFEKSQELNIDSKILSSICLLHEIGHYLDFKFRLKDRYFTPRDCSFYTVQVCEVQAWLQAAQFIKEYNIPLNDFLKICRFCLESYGVSNLKLDLLINGMKNRFNKTLKKAG